jgi:hypothetical protein
VRFKLRAIMAWVGVTALILAAYRVDSAPTAGALIISGSGLYLAYRRCDDELAWRAARGEATSRFQTIEIFVASALVSFTIIGVADLAFLLGFFGYMACWRSSHGVTDFHEIPDTSPEHILMGAAFGFFMALFVASFLRSAIWPVSHAPTSPAISSDELTGGDSMDQDENEPDA